MRVWGCIVNTLISVRYRNNREGLVDDVTLNELILTGRIRQFYRLSEGRWVDIEKDPVRRNVEDQPGFGRRATDRKREEITPATPRKFLDRLRKPLKAPEPPGPLTARDWFDKGFLLLFTSDDIPGAIRAFATAIRLDPDYARAYLNRGMAYERIGNLQQAVEDFSKAIDLEPEEGKIYYIRGVAHRRLGMAKEALEDLRKAAALGYRSARETLRSMRIDW
jgi:tetratricopeptide (TPR) repeat protein